MFLVFIFVVVYVFSFNLNKDILRVVSFVLIRIEFIIIFNVIRGFC